MNVKRLPNGKLCVPVRVEFTDPKTGHTILGDATEDVGPGHPDYHKWVAWLNRMDRINAKQRTES